MNNTEETQAIAALKAIALANLKEQRAARRWGVFFKSLLALYLFVSLGFLLFTLYDTRVGLKIEADEITALVEVQGVIADNSEAGADYVISGLRRAFEHPKTKGVILRINSPGGSPVQSGYINDEIKRLKAKHSDIPVYAVITDMCASGGYYVAVAADKIYADKASIVGSIGVRMDSFGAVDALAKLGIERRLYTAGDNKGLLDPFLPERANEVSHIEGMLDVIHQQFIAVVKEGRGERLKNDPDIFSGLIWSGESAVDLGLIDGLGSSSYVAREVIGAEHIVSFTAKKDFLQRLSERMSASARQWVLNSQVELQTPRLY